jgi:hypothetical protein
MPFVKIHVLEGRYDEARLDSVSNAIQQALRAELGTAPDELFQIIHLLQPAQFRHTRSFLGLNYSEDLIWLELTLIAGRLAKEKRLGLLKALNDRIVDAAQISPDDLLITPLRLTSNPANEPLEYFSLIKKGEAMKEEQPQQRLKGPADYRGASRTCAL